MPLLDLPAGSTSGLSVRPRWPSRQVRVEGSVVEALLAVQARMPAGVKLVLTRGFEPPSRATGRLRSLARRMGTLVFLLVYPRRHREIGPIFGPNGHDTDGTHVDISIALDGRDLRFLPFGVFTPPAWQNRRTKQHSALLDRVRTALGDAGFEIHSNPTESLQIHCDFTPVR